MGTVIVDYGAGNLRSVTGALGRLGADCAVSACPEDLEGADRIILPGVGSFAAAMDALVHSGLAGAVRDAVGRGVPLLGICLGMQLLFEQGTEGRAMAGLGLLPGRVSSLPSVPGLPRIHIGWNSISIRRADPLLEDVPDGSFFYFVHSYAVEPGDDGLVAAVTAYGSPFPSVVSSGLVSGVQFHPEKSQTAGLSLLSRFLGQGGGS